MSQTLTDVADPRDVATTGIAAAGLHEVLRWAVAHATLAPSELNTQPWAFTVETFTHGQSGVLELWLDPERCLEQIDPTRREAVLACGAALLNLRLALVGAELLPEVRLCPDPASRDLLATVTVRSTTHEPPEATALRAAVLARTTSRGPFPAEPLAPEVLDSLVQAVRAEGASVRLVRPHQRAEIARATAASQDWLWSQPALRREASAWARSNTDRSGDGVPGYAFGEGNVRAFLGPARQAHGGPPPWTGEQQARAVLDAPALLVIGTEHEDRAQVLRAGAGMQRMLLAATTSGLATSYVNAPLHRPESRARLGELLDLACPQILVRVGHGARSPLTPRRPLGQVLSTRVTPP